MPTHVRRAAWRSYRAYYSFTVRLVQASEQFVGTVTHELELLELLESLEFELYLYPFCSLVTCSFMQGNAVWPSASYHEAHCGL